VCERDSDECPLLVESGRLARNGALGLAAVPLATAPLTSAGDATHIHQAKRQV
jgi:hypothetical protein